MSLTPNFCQFQDFGLFRQGYNKCVKYFCFVFSLPPFSCHVEAVRPTPRFQKHTSVRAASQNETQNHALFLMSRISISCCTLSSFQVGNHRLKCRNGAWSGQFPVCTGQFCQNCYKFVFRCIIQNIKIFSYSTSVSIKYSLFSSCRKMQSFTATTTQQWQGLTISIILLLYHLHLF